MKLELRHIAGYLPYGLTGVCTEEYQGIETVNGVIWNSSYLEFRTTVDDCDFTLFKPILRPLSDLTKEIEVNGEKFVPAIALAELTVEKGLFYKNGDFEFDYKIVQKPFGQILKVSFLDSWVVVISLSEVDRAKHFLVQKLLEWHFDIHNLIENGLAVDINTLKTE